MNKAYARLAAGISMFSLATIAYAGAPIQLSDRQMDTVTAGNANAITAIEASAVGRNTALHTNIGNIALESPSGSLAQTRTAVLATGTNHASVATDVVNQSAANGHGSARVATASTAGSASGDTATVHSVDMTSAISASAGPGHSSIGIADSLAYVTTFSASGKSR